jgi:hypothetical protein
MKEEETTQAVIKEGKVEKGRLVVLMAMMIKGVWKGVVVMMTVRTKRRRRR